MARVVSKRAIELIESFELMRLKAYQGAADRAGVWTIGYGHVITGHEVPDLFRPGQQMRDVVITKDRAEALLVEDLGKAASGVTMRLNPDMAAKLNDDQYGALVSLTFNIGVGNFAISSVRKTINVGDINSAAEAFRSFVSVRKIVENLEDGTKESKLVPTPGLIRRRAAEKALYKSEYDTMTYFLNNSNSTSIVKARRYLDIDAV